MKSVSVRAAGSSVSTSPPRRTSTPWFSNQASSSIGRARFVELPAQELLRERRALIGHDELGREQRHVAFPARGPVPAGGGERGGAAADDQQLHASKRSRAYSGVQAL